MNLIFQKMQHKIQTWEQAAKTIAVWKTAQEQIVFTNGCFDLIHYGHLHYLADAAALGSKLIIGLNSDASVGRLKGIHRPIKDQSNRAHLLACLDFVDLVVLFEEDTPLNLITLLKPDFLVKGGDWKVEQIIGSKVVLENGGKVLSLPFVEGYSTTSLEQKILKAHQNA